MKNKFLVAFPIAFMMMVIIACTSTSANSNANNSGIDQTNTEIISEVTTDKQTQDIILLVKDAMVGYLGSADEVLDVVLENNQLTISVKLAECDDPKALAISRFSSITDSILGLEEINEVETIKVEFEGIGSVTKNVSEAIDDGYGKYFVVSDSDLK